MIKELEKHKKNEEQASKKEKEDVEECENPAGN